MLPMRAYERCFYAAAAIRHLHQPMIFFSIAAADAIDDIDRRCGASADARCRRLSMSHFDAACVMARLILLLTPPNAFSLIRHTPQARRAMRDRDRAY